LANLIAITYEDAGTARKAMEIVDWAAFDKQANVLDACWMTNESGKVSVKPQGHPVAGKAALAGTAGLIIGALFAVPVVGLAAGAIIGGYRAKHKEHTFDDDFVESIKAKVENGGSAIVVLYEEGADTERAGAELAQLGGTVYSTTIPQDQLAQIQEELDRNMVDN
jgi:uncharacterized membrane protein